MLTLQQTTPAYGSARSSLTPTVLLLAVLLGGCGRRDAASAAAAAPPVRRLAVRAQPCAVRAFERRLTVQGTLEAKRFAHVAARADGNLDAIWVNVGDRVTAEETPLFQIDPVGRQNAVTIAEQAHAVAQATLAVARAQTTRSEAEARKSALDFQRFVRLHEQKQISENEYEEAEVRQAQAKAGVAVAAAQADLAARQVLQADAALAIAQKNLKDTRVLAPLSGVVSRRLAEPGEQMAVGRVLLRIDDLTAVEAAAFIPAQYYPEIRPGETRFRLGVQGRDAGTHTVTLRAPTVNPVLRTFEIKGLVADVAEWAVPGAMADVTIIFETSQNLGVPAASVLLRGGRSMVFVVTDGRAVARTVETGWQNDGWIAILSGLEVGEPVVTEGQTQLSAGATVDVL